MGFIDRLASWQARSHVENPVYPLTSARLVEVLGGTPTASGEIITPKSALSLTAVFRATKLIASTCAGVPLRVYELDDRDNKIDVTAQHPVFLDPHPEMTALELWEWVYLMVETHGNAYLQKIRFAGGNRSRDVVAQLHPISPERIRPGRTSDGMKVFEFSGPNGETIPLTSQEVLHIPGMSYDGVIGLSPIGLARQSLGTSKAAENYAGLLFGRGALMSGILQTDRKLSVEAADALRSRWQDMFGGLGGAHKIAVLDQGAKFQPVSITPEEAQFLESRKFGVVEVARLFGVPPHLLMETSAASNWGTGLEEQTRGFLIFGLAEKLGRVAARTTKELLPAPARFAEHRTAKLLSADTLSRYRSYSLAIRDGWLSRADVRRRENEPVFDESLEDYGPPARGPAVVE